MKSFNKKILILILIVFIGAGTLGVARRVLAESCLTFSGTQEQKRIICEAELAQYQKEIADLEGQLSTQKKTSTSISSEVKVLQSQIAQAKLKIKSRQITIEKLATDIKTKETKITILEDKISNQKESLGQLLRRTDQFDNKTLVHVVLSSQTLSDFYSDVGTFASINDSLKASVDSLQGAKTETEQEKESLEDKKNEEIGVKVELENAKKKVESSESAQKKLLSVSKNKEAEFQKYKSEKEKVAAQIRAALFTLAGGGGGIPFGDAYVFAVAAQAKTGVNPALTLAILTQESRLGANTGQCYLADASTGAGISVKSQNSMPKTMHPTRDVPVFLKLTAKLGRDPYKTLISCPLSYGYGGAMGPSQFIPSTWILYESKVANATGKASADPWIPEDAFMATALYIRDLGGASSSYSDQKNAACKYYSGQSCSRSSAANGYGASVMTKMNDIQVNKIDLIKNI